MMASNETPDRRRKPLLAYDGDCRMCIRSIHSLELLGLLEGVNTEAAALVTGDDRQLLDTHRRSGEIVLLDAERQDVKTGAAAFRWLLQRKLPRFVGALLDLAPIFLLMCIGYRFIASWRRLISPPLSAPDPTFPEPEWVARYRMIGAIALIAAIYWLVPLIMGSPPPLNDELDRALTIAAASMVAISVVVITLIAQRGRRIDYLATLSAAIFVSTIALAILVLLKKKFEGSGNPLLEPWGLFAGSTIWGFAILFRCRKWLDAYSVDSSDSEDPSGRQARPRLSRFLVLAAIQVSCQIWIAFLYGVY
ncbi:MAG: DCC1-like thiol-disulfide oxidoreductase family protein [Planctomycetota bacterium]|nr:DCC1-like thiol-disulfide oxidoreductase family protein [Planctomycetota bacterium]